MNRHFAKRALYAAIVTTISVPSIAAGIGHAATEKSLALTEQIAAAAALPPAPRNPDAVALDTAAMLWRQSLALAERAKADGTVTFASIPGAQCYQNFPGDASTQLLYFPAALQAQIQFQSYPSTTSCAAIGMSVYVGYFAFTDRTVTVWAPTVAAGQTLCSTGLIEACAVGTAPPPPPAPPPTGPFVTVISRLGDQCYQNYPQSARVIPPFSA
jgi:hypothetical protein